MNFVKNIISRSLSFKVLIPSASRVILAYHDVSEINSPQYSELYSTKPGRFFEQIEFLQQNFNLVSLDEIISANSSVKPMVAITFDDGFLSVKELALKFLKAQNIPFAVFLNQTAIKENYLPYDQFDEINRRYKTQVYLNANDIRDLHKDGVIIGSHTSNHRTIANCDEKILGEEIDENKKFLEDLIGEKVLHFAIPYGKKEHYNEKSVAHCQTAGHQFIYSTNPIYFSKAVNSETLIPRIGISNQTPKELCFLINRPLIKKIDI